MKRKMYFIWAIIFCLVFVGLPMTVSAARGESRLKVGETTELSLTSGGGSSWSYEWKVQSGGECVQIVEDTNSYKCTVKGISAGTGVVAVTQIYRGNPGHSYEWNVTVEEPVEDISSTVSGLYPHSTNSLSAEVGGIQETYYLADSEKSANGQYNWYSLYKVPKDGEKKISLCIDPDIAVGSYKTGDYGLTLYYKDANGDTHYAEDSHGDYTLTITKNDSSGVQLNGSFVATAVLLSGGDPVQIKGDFSLNYGEVVAEAKEIMDSKNTSSGNTSTAGSGTTSVDLSDPITDSREKSTKVDHTCRSCQGHMICEKCAGRGQYYKYSNITYGNSGSNMALITCPRCNGSGRCPVCKGTGKIY